jgi:colanic acid biosynthesis glycosyl transferase WcaI
MSQIELGRGPSLHIQLWSYNYAPEPTGIGPVSETWALALAARGHRVEVVAAHPHYPEPAWGRRFRPYRERRRGIDVLRLPLWIGRMTATQRFRQEVSFMTAQSLALPALAVPDVSVVVSPSFPALVPALLGHRVRRTPWLLWLQDILPDGAQTVGLVDDGPVLRVSRLVERAAYAAADRIALASPAFRDNLLAKGVPATKLEVITNPATRTPAATHVAAPPDPAMSRVLTIGNIGHTQGLGSLVAAFESDRPEGVTLVIAGTGVAADSVRANIRSDRVEMLGLIDDDALERELAAATFGLVSQVAGRQEFNFPSKLMNLMSYGLPIIAIVDPTGEVARVVDESRGGWVLDSRTPSELPRLLAALRKDTAEVRARAEAARTYAREHFSVERFADRFETALLALSASRDKRVRRQPHYDPLPCPPSSLSRADDIPA